MYLEPRKDSLDGWLRVPAGPGVVLELRPAGLRQDYAHASAIGPKAAI